MASASASADVETLRSNDQTLTSK